MSTLTPQEKEDREVLELEAALLEIEATRTNESSSSSTESDASSQAPQTVAREDKPERAGPTPRRGFSLWASRIGNVWSIFRFSAINLLLPFVNGMMLGFGEIAANEIGVRWGFIGAELHPVRANIRRQVERRRALESEKNNR